MARCDHVSVDPLTEPLIFSFIKKILTIFIILVLSAGGIAACFLYRTVFSANVNLPDDKEHFLLVPTGSEFKDVCHILTGEGILKNLSSFEWVARRLSYPEKVKPGRYRIFSGMSNIELVRLLRSGRQEPVKVTFLNIRSKEDLAGRISKQIEADSTSLSNLFRDPEYLIRYGVTPSTVLALFIPNTYEFYWNTSAKDFTARMAKEKDKFWKGEREERCKQTGLTILQVVTLASIVEKETNVTSEKPVIAGVYMNRLRKGMLLQADPTIIYAWNNYSIRRVKGDLLKIQSPYNTYLYPGLPPGPICIPSISSVDAVLNYSRHNYLYFCAKDDLSGSHAFSPDFEQHTRNARKYQSAIKKQGIH